MDRKYDAIMIPAETLRAVNLEAFLRANGGEISEPTEAGIRINAMKERYGHLMGLGEKDTIHSTRMVGGIWNDYRFMRPELDATVCFPVGHPYEKRPRYHWIKLQDGCYAGKLIPLAGGKLPDPVPVDGGEFLPPGAKPAKSQDETKLLETKDSGKSA